MDARSHQLASSASSSWRGGEGMPAAARQMEDWSALFLARASAGQHIPADPARAKPQGHRRSLTRAMSEHREPEERASRLHGHLSPGPLTLSSAGSSTWGRLPAVQSLAREPFAPLPDLDDRERRAQAQTTSASRRLHQSPLEAFSPLETKSYCRQRSSPCRLLSHRSTAGAVGGGRDSKHQAHLPDNAGEFSLASGDRTERPFQLQAADTCQGAGEWQMATPEWLGFSTTGMAPGASTSARIAYAGEASRLGVWAPPNREELGESGDEEDDLTLSAAVLRKLTRGPKSGKPHRRSGSFSWRGLERSCKRLDAAQIKISTLDLSLAEDALDTEVVYNFQLETSQDDQPPHSEINLSVNTPSTFLHPQEILPPRGRTRDCSAPAAADLDTGGADSSAGGGLPGSQASNYGTRVQKPGLSGERASCHGFHGAKLVHMLHTSASVAECESSRTSESNSSSSRELPLIGSCLTTPSTVGSASVNNHFSSTCSHSAPRLVESESCAGQGEGSCVGADAPSENREHKSDGRCLPAQATADTQKRGERVWVPFVPKGKGRSSGLQKFVQKLRGRIGRGGAI